ncbi:MAG: pantetheine-phosphate adenylyltransferase [Deltaproteobacteria bacterium]|jgi:pantetheine-phosphate adenylyltransferase|nr:pantetheine-phosphate adenylyltransferase [Deltaproteobacteria bacterium]
MTTCAIYPGTFDPPTLGHTGLVERILAVFDRLIIVVARNPKKNTLFTVEERVEMLRESLGDLLTGRVVIDSFDGLMVEYARKHKAKAIVRGLRGASDFDYEFQLAMINRHLDQDIQSVFLMADYQWFFISSSTVKEAASLGAEITDLVPPFVARKLKVKFGSKA